MNLTREEMVVRAHEFEPISFLLNNNTIVRCYVDAYIHGAILTKEETLFQIVRELAKSREQIMQDIHDDVIIRTHIGPY